MGLAYNLIARCLQQRARERPKVGVIVDDQDRGRHPAIVARGNAAHIRVVPGTDATLARSRSERVAKKSPKSRRLLLRP